MFPFEPILVITISDHRAHGGWCYKRDNPVPPLLPRWRRATHGKKTLTRQGLCVSLEISVMGTCRCPFKDRRQYERLSMFHTSVGSRPWLSVHTLRQETTQPLVLDSTVSQGPHAMQLPGLALRGDACLLEVGSSTRLNTHWFESRRRIGAPLPRAIAAERAHGFPEATWAAHCQHQTCISGGGNALPHGKSRSFEGKLANGPQLLELTQWPHSRSLYLFPVSTPLRHGDRLGGGGSMYGRRGEGWISSDEHDCGLSGSEAQLFDLAGNVLPLDVIIRRRFL